MDLLTLELILIALLWGYFVWRDPKGAFVNLPLLLPTYVVRTNIGPIPMTALELMILATFVAWFFKEGWLHAYIAGKQWRNPVLLFLIAGLVAIVVSPETIKAIGLYRAYFIEPLLVFFMGLGLIKTMEDRRELARSFGITTIVLGAWAAFQYVTGYGIPHPWDLPEGRRAVGPFPYPNALALFMTPLAAFAFADRFRGKEVRFLPELLGWATVVAGVTAIVLAKSDGGLIAFAAAAFVALAMHRRTQILATALIFLALITLTQFPDVQNRITDLVTFREWSGKVRTVMWEETVTMLRDRPFFGAGLSAYPTVIKPYHKATWMEIFQYPHNIFLNLWSEIGILGTIAFVWILVRWIRLSKSENHHIGTLDITIPIVIALVVHGLVDVPYFKNDLAVAFWLLIILTTTSNRLLRDQS